MRQKNLKGKHPKYTDNIFINCPFDINYKDIFHALVFTIVDCGFVARCALESSASSEIRIEKIMRIIEECKYGIHDISRTELDKGSKLPRFNMPLELGIFIGCKKYFDSDKSYIIFDSKDYRYQQFISDIAGQDIRIHNNNIEDAISKTRDYLKVESDRITIPSGKKIIERFFNFLEVLPIMCKEEGFDIKKLSFIDYFHCVKAYMNVMKLSSVLAANPIAVRASYKRAKVKK